MTRVFWSKNKVTIRDKKQKDKGHGRTCKLCINIIKKITGTDDQDDRHSKNKTKVTD